MLTVDEIKDIVRIDEKAESSYKKRTVTNHDAHQH